MGYGIQRRKWQAAGMAVLASALVVAGCGSAGGGQTENKTVGANVPANAAGGGSGSAGTVKVGALLTFTGPYAPLGESIRNGFELYLDEHHRQLGGRNAEVKYEDDQFDPQVALRK
ncbi:MAG: ABC transporter substrate-binding protein, partial [Alicyclobacillus sp.]|nr:ABC transporter substrate-binding protein [Alicyclobacillus sp.]